jgi:hypothetical protein
MTRCSGLMDKVNTQINMLGTLASTDGALRPGNACLIVSEYQSRGSLSKAKIAQELAEIYHFLNHSRGLDEFRFGRRQGNCEPLTLGTPRDNCTVQHEHETRGGSPRVLATSPIRVNIAPQGICWNFLHRRMGSGSFECKAKSSSYNEIPGWLLQDAVSQD